MKYIPVPENEQLGELLSSDMQVNGFTEEEVKAKVDYMWAE